MHFPGLHHDNPEGLTSRKTKVEVKQLAHKESKQKAALTSAKTKHYQELITFLYRCIQGVGLLPKSHGTLSAHRQLMLHLLGYLSYFSTENSWLSSGY